LKGKLVIISAPSGAGKTTIVSHLLGKRLNLEFSVSATTRKPRDQETEGKDYYFITLVDFKKRILNDEFVEWEEVYKDHFYGTLKCEVNRILSKGKHVLFDVDAKGGISLKNIFGNKAIAVFIMPPSARDLEKRLLKRGTDDPARIKIRVKKAIGEMKSANQFDNIIINDQLERALNETVAIVSSLLIIKSDPNV